MAYWSTLVCFVLPLVWLFAQWPISLLFQLLMFQVTLVITQRNQTGLFLVILALVMNAMQDNSQEKGMKELGVPENELVRVSWHLH